MAHDLSQLKIDRSSPPPPKPWGKIAIAAIGLGLVGAGFVVRRAASSGEHT